MLILQCNTFFLEKFVIIYLETIIKQSATSKLELRNTSGPSFAEMLLLKKILCCFVWGFL